MVKLNIQWPSIRCTREISTWLDLLCTSPPPLNNDVVFQATGARLGTVAMTLSTIITCLVYAFYNGWKLSFVLLAFIPFLVIASAVQMKTFTGNSHAEEDEDGLVQSGKVSCLPS